VYVDLASATVVASAVKWVSSVMVSINSSYKQLVKSTLVVATVPTKKAYKIVNLVTTTKTRTKKINRQYVSTQQSTLMDTVSSHRVQEA